MPSNLVKSIFVVLQRDILARLHQCWAKSLVTVRDTSTTFSVKSLKMRTISDSSAVVSDSSLAELPSESHVRSQRY